MRRRLMRLKRLRHDPRYPLVLVGLMGIGAYVLFIIRLLWG
jgi:hypothetical protein